jgi:hypothetical protein
MDGVFFLVLIVFAALSAALLGLCAALDTNAPGGAKAERSGQTTRKDSAQDRGL